MDAVLMAITKYRDKHVLLNVAKEELRNQTSKKDAKYTFCLY